MRAQYTRVIAGGKLLGKKAGRKCQNFKRGCAEVALVVCFAGFQPAARSGRRLKACTTKLREQTYQKGAAVAAVFAGGAAECAGAGIEIDEAGEGAADVNAVGIIGD